jgi:hypothetical protein
MNEAKEGVPGLEWHLDVEEAIMSVGAEGVPLLMTLLDVARLAKVQRPVVTVWRARCARPGRVPFPAPVATVRGEDRFEANAVVDWMETTGLGNNPQAREDAAGCASPMGFSPEDDAVIFNGLAALLCLKEITGAVLGDLGDAALLDHADEADPEDEYLFGEIDALGDRRLALCGYVDSLANAVYNVADAFEQLVGARFRLVVPGHTAVSPCQPDERAGQRVYGVA